MTTTNNLNTNLPVRLAG